MQPTPSPLRYEGAPPSCQSWASILTVGDLVGGGRLTPSRWTATYQALASMEKSTRTPQANRQKNAARAVKRKPEEAPNRTLGVSR